MGLVKFACGLLPAWLMALRRWLSRRLGNNSRADDPICRYDAVILQWLNTMITFLARSPRCGVFLPFQRGDLFVFDGQRQAAMLQFHSFCAKKLAPPAL